MRRILVPVILLAVVLSVLIAIRLHSQGAALRAASGGSGEIEGTEVRLASRISARVLEVPAREGTQVKKGDLLLTLDCTEARAALDEAQARLASAQAQAKAADSASGASRGALRAAQSASEASRAQVEALADQRDVTRRQADRLDQLGEFAALSNRDQTRTSAAGLEHQVDAARASSNAASAQARAAVEQSHAAAAQAESARAAISAAESAVTRARLLVDECEVRAPRDAWVEHIAFEAGELVAPGSTLVRLVDLTEVKATFYLPNSEVAAARPGAEALVQVDAYPGETFHGTVRTVSAKAEFTPRNIQTRTDRDRLVYPVEVVLRNADGRLREGMPVQVSLPGTER